MSRKSIDFEDTSEIIYDSDGLPINHLEDSHDPDMSGFDSKLDSYRDYSAISEESLDKVFGAFSPDQPTTYEKLATEYNKIKRLIESEQRTLTAKKVTLRFEIDDLQEKNELLKAENVELKSANESLQQKNVSLQEENERLVQVAIQKSETLLNEMKTKGGTRKRRKKRKSTKFIRKNE